MSVIRNSARAFIGAKTATPATDAPAVFDGPAQVRTSTLAILTASFVPAAVFALAAIPFFAAIFRTWHATDWSTQILEVALPSYLFMILVPITLLPAAIVVGITHAMARSLQRIGSVDYAVIGALVSFGAALMMSSLLPTVMLMPAAVILAGALMGAAYRRFAGLEPRSLPKAMLATVPRHLAGKRHPARRSHAAIING
jgi:hypothetical protein